MTCEEEIGVIANPLINPEYGIFNQKSGVIHKDGYGSAVSGIEI